MREGNNDSPSHCSQSRHSDHEHFSAQSKLFIPVVHRSTHPAAVVAVVVGAGVVGAVVVGEVVVGVVVGGAVVICEAIIVVCLVLWDGVLFCCAFSGGPGIGTNFLFSS